MQSYPEFFLTIIPSFTMDKDNQTMRRFHNMRSSDTFILIAMCIAIFTDTFIYGMVRYSD